MPALQAVIGSGAYTVKILLASYLTLGKGSVYCMLLQFLKQLAFNSIGSQMNMFN
uniref:Uncharacterized protein n=1 Tax=Anguilla anguilla TaxID=7936 RepID=A0A0E9WRU3_ANGAN